MTQTDSNPLEGPFALYQVGNSLTSDSLPSAHRFLAGSMGVGLSNGYHWRASQSLKFIVENPADVTLQSGGTWSNALDSTARNFFAFQPYPQSSNTMIEEQNAFMRLVQEVEGGPSVAPKFFIYVGWPSRTATADNYSAYWDQAVIDADATLVILKAQFFDHFYSRIKALRPSTFIVPIGQVFRAFDAAARSGQIPGIASVNDLYQDALHMGDAGRFAAACTLMTTLLKRPCVSKDVRYLYRLGLPGAELTDALAQIIEDLAWQVVSSDLRTGVT